MIDGQTDGGDCNIPIAFLKSLGITRFVSALKSRKIEILYTSTATCE